jgi:hypothetical protein
MQQMLLLLQH